MTPQAKVLLLLIPIAAAHLALHLAQDMSPSGTDTPLSAIPANILEFHQAGSDLPIDSHITELLETPDVLMRDYVSDRGIPVQLTVVRSGATRRSLHFPEVCLTGQGWEVREQYSAPVGVYFVGKRLIIFRGDSQLAVLYWFKTADYVTGSYFLNSAFWAKEQLMFRAPKSMMIRLSTPIGASGAETAFDRLDDFAQGLTPMLAESF